MSSLRGHSGLRGCFDDEFAEESLAFFEAVRNGKFVLVVSPTVLAELQRAPEQVREILAGLPASAVEIIEIGTEVEHLRDAYLAVGILRQEHKSDAEHIASASVAEADFVVSWNFKHIVHFEKISGYQAVNLLNGDRVIRIHSPREMVIDDEEEQEI